MSVNPAHQLTESFHDKNPVVLYRYQEVVQPIILTNTSRAYGSAVKEMNGNTKILEVPKTRHCGIDHAGGCDAGKGLRQGTQRLTCYTAACKIAVSPPDAGITAEGKHCLQYHIFQYCKAGSHKKVKTFRDFKKAKSAGTFFI